MTISKKINLEELDETVNKLKTQGGAKKRGSKKSSQKGSKKSSQKGSKKSLKKGSKMARMVNADMMETMVGGSKKKASKKSSKSMKGGAKKFSKKDSKKGSKSMVDGKPICDDWKEMDYESVGECIRDQTGGKKGSKKASKKVSKKASKKSSKKVSKKDSKLARVLDIELDMEGGKSKGSKKSSKKGSMKRELPPALKAAQVVNEKVLKATGAERSDWFGLIKYINVLRKEAKKTVKDEKDFEAVNKKIMELFEKDLESKGKGKVASMIKAFAEEAKANRGKK